MRFLPSPAPCRKCRRCHPVQPAVWSMVIIIQSPAINNISRLGKAQEQFAIEAFVPKLTVEALDVSVFPRAARLDEQRSDLCILKPPSHSFTGKFRTVIATEIFWLASNRKKLFQYLEHVLARKVPSDLDRQAFTRIFVHDTQHTQSAAALGAIAYKIIAPDVVFAQRPMSMAGIVAVAQSSAFTGLFSDLQTFCLPQSMHSLDVYTPTVDPQQGGNATIPKPRPFQCQSVRLGYQSMLVR